MNIYLIKTVYVAQLDKASDTHAVGRRFETVQTITIYLKIIFTSDIIYNYNCV